MGIQYNNGISVGSKPWMNFDFIECFTAKLGR